MADTKKISALDALTSAASGDYLYIIDVSDTSGGAAGTSKKIAYSDLISAASLLVAMGITASATELNYVDGVTSAIQTQLDAKATASSVSTLSSTVSSLSSTVSGKADAADPVFTGTVTLPTGLTGVLRADSGVVFVDSDITDLVAAASATVAGVVELATAAETTTGTDANRAVTPDGLAGSNYGKRTAPVGVVESDTAVTTGDGKVGIPITEEFNGFNIIGVQANVYTKGVTGTTDVQIRRQRGATDSDVLSTKVTIGDEYYAADGVINEANDDLATGDMLFIDVDAVHSGTPPNGLSVAITVQLP